MNWEDTNANATETYIGAHIYIGIMDLPTLQYNFYGHIIILQFKKIEQYLHLSSGEHSPKPTNNKYNSVQSKSSFRISKRNSKNIIFHLLT